MRVVIDWDLCVGSGLCVAEAPGSFALVPCGQDLRAVLVAPLDEAGLQAAARACPTLAIRLVDASGRPVYPPPPRPPALPRSPSSPTAPS
jgi:ferredoxin